MENYKKEIIPYIGHLNKNADELSDKINNSAVYNFNDLYKKSKNGKCCKDIFKDDINKLLNRKFNDRAKENNEISGLYIFYEENKPVYIGISKTIIRRIKQHMCGKTRNESSLAFLITKHKYGSDAKQHYSRFREAIQKQMQEKWRIKIIPEERPYERYFFEVYFSIKLQTYWNSFETH